MKSIYLVSLLLTLSHCSNNHPQKSLDMDAIKNRLNLEVQQDKSPSVHYLFFRPDSIIFEYSTGFSDLKSGTPADSATTFNGLSITKTFTALAILQLMENGQIELDKPVRHYLPTSTISPQVTVKHLLTHTSGLANPLPLNWIHLVSEHQNFNRNHFFLPILTEKLKLKSTPGSKFTYSNLGYLYLGQIIENISGISYEDYIRNNVLNRLPLQPDVLDFKVPHDTLHAKGYHKRRSFSMLLLNFMIDKSKFMEAPVKAWKPFKSYYINGAPYGGMIGNAHGFVKYGQELLKDNGLLISEKSKKLLFTENMTSNGQQTGMCLSWFTGMLGNHAYVTHAGGGGGYYCELRLYPDLKSGSFIVFNRSGFKNERFLDQLDLYLLK